MVFIKKVVGRPLTYNEDTCLHSDGDHLLVLLDVYEDGTCVETCRLFFADHAGLEAEYEAGVATTVLESAVGDVIADLTGDSHTTTQRGAMDDYPISEP